MSVPAQLEAWTTQRDRARGMLQAFGTRTEYEDSYGSSQASTSVTVVPHGSSLPYTTDSQKVWYDIYRSVCLYALFKYDSTQGMGTPVLSPMERQVPRKGLHFMEPSLPLCHMLEGV